MNNNSYIEHLYDNTTDGYISLMQIDKDRQVKIYSTENKAIREIIEEHKGQEDRYISPNTFYIPKRNTRNIRQFRALYIDIDKAEDNQCYIGYKVFELAQDGVIPMPSMIVDSGRGVHLYWKIKNAPYGASNTWQELEDMLYYRLKHLGADKKATDGARVLRIPGSINSKNNKECRVMYIDNDLEYSMYDLREKYLNYKKKINKVIKENKKIVTNAFFNSYSLHMARAEDLETLCKLRNYNVLGNRNMIIHCYAYWLGIYERNLEVLESRVQELNNSFRKPLRNSEIRNIIKSIDKAIDKFIEYEQEIRNGKDKRVTKGMRDKGGYWYKNETLIKRLEITEDEQKHLKTIIDTKEKYYRNNKRRREERANRTTLTKKQQELQELKHQVLKLKEQGLNNSEIARKLNIDRKKVSRLVNN